jgi:maltose-binding protein MalE
VVATDASRAEALQQFGDEFQAAYGVDIRFEVIHTTISDRLNSLFATPTRLGDAVDALIGAHDWIGALAEQGLIEPIVLSQEHRQAFRPWTLRSLTHDGKVYGLPTTLDTTVLLRNLDRIPHSPGTMEELIATSSELLRKGVVTDALAVRVGNEGDPFQLWPLFVSAGGSLLGKVDGMWDPTRVELASQGSINAFERLRSLGEQGAKLLRRSMDRSEAFNLFANGHAPYLITTSDGLEHARRAGIRVAVSQVPPFSSGESARGMSLVHGLFIGKSGQNRLLAHDLFSDYLTHRNVMVALSKTVVCPVALRAVPSQDPDLQQFQEICEMADPMPSFRGMRQVWEIVGRAQAAAISGAPAEATARSAANDVKLALENAGAC